MYETLKQGVHTRSGLDEIATRHVDTIPYFLTPNEVVHRPAHPSANTALPGHLL